MGPIINTWQPTQLHALAVRIRDLHAITPDKLDCPLWHSYADPTRFVRALKNQLDPLHQQVCKS